MSDAAFHTLKLTPALLKVVGELGYKQMTPIQAQTIPVLMAGRDLIGQSKTGSGKTAAFSIPFLEKLDSAAGKPQVIVLCPTRELCAQVGREIRKIGRYRKNLQVLIVSGGQPMGVQIDALDKGVHVVVGTPGRVIDHLDKGSLDLSKLKTLVLDEADEMLGMGFCDDLEFIIQCLNHDHQTLLFSATMPKGIIQIAKHHMKDYHTLKIEKSNKTPSSLEHLFKLSPHNRRQEDLIHAIRTLNPAQAIIFCHSRIQVEKVCQGLKREFDGVDYIHAGISQDFRNMITTKFRNGKIRILVATDVVARGLDFSNVSHVFILFLPKDHDVYIHRSGRTGRYDKTGTVVSFIARQEIPQLENMTTKLGITIKWID